MNDRRTVIGEIMTWMQVKLALPTPYVRILVFKPPSVESCIGSNQSAFRPDLPLNTTGKTCVYCYRKFLAIVASLWGGFSFGSSSDFQTTQQFAIFKRYFNGF